MKPRIVVETVPNPNYLLFHATALLSDARQVEFHRPLRESSKTYLEKLGGEGGKLVVALFDIDGVTSVLVQPYCVGVTKGEAFSWDDIKPKALDALKAVFVARGTSAESVEVADEGYKPGKRGLFV